MSAMRERSSINGLCTTNDAIITPIAAILILFLVVSRMRIYSSSSRSFFHLSSFFTLRSRRSESKSAFIET